MRVLFASLGVILIWQLEIVAGDKLVPVRRNLTYSREYKQCLSKVDCPLERRADSDKYDYRHFWCCQGTCSLELCQTCSVSILVSKNQLLRDLYQV